MIEESDSNAIFSRLFYVEAFDRFLVKLFLKLLILRINSTKIDRIFEFWKKHKPRPTRLRLFYFDNAKIIELISVL